MGKRWNDNEPPTRVANRLQDSEGLHKTLESATGTVRRIAGEAYADIQRFERRAEQQIRSYPVSSILIAAGVGVAIGSLLVAALSDSIRATSHRRSWTKFF